MRKIIFTTLVLTATLSLAACAPQGEPGEEPVASAFDELSSLGKKLVGDLHYADGDNIYETLSLRANGKYSASWKPCPEMAKCAQYLEEGSWSTSGQKTLRLHPKHAPVKSFSVSIAGDGSGFKISANGRTERLDRDGVGQVGDFCGGIAPLPCGAGLECVLDGNFPDAGGTCQVPGAQMGELCGGFAGLPCAAGLDCVIDGTYPDAAGTCQRHAGLEGEMCGGIAAFPCAKDLTCVLAASYPDAAGTCMACPIPECAAPPAGCYYQTTPPEPGSCPSGCGTLVCDGSGL